MSEKKTNSQNSSDSPVTSPELRERLQKLFVLGNEQMSRGNYDYAGDIYLKECVLKDPNNLIYFKTFLINYKKKLEGQKRKKQSFLSGGKKKLASKKPEQVFQAGIEALKSNPWDVDILLETGDACEQLGCFDAAVEYFRAAVEAEPDHIEANMRCGEALRNIADYHGALRCINRILKQRPTDHEALKIRQELTVEMTIHRGKYGSGDSVQVREAAQGMLASDEDAMGRRLSVPEQIERRIKKEPAEISNYVELAQFYYQLADYANAEKVYARAVPVSNNEPTMIDRLLDAQKCRLRQEVLDLKEKYETNPNENGKAVFFAKRTEYEVKKRELIEHQIQTNPNHAGHRFEYGLLLLKDGKVKEAISEFQTAKVEETIQGDCLFALGQCFQTIKQYKLAMTHYKEAIAVLKTGENKKKALYQAAKLALALGDYNAAEEYGQQLAAIDYAYRDIAQLLDEIAAKKAN
ncbi:hypothetical protein FACS189454_07010 [Planctomycetales bacterium]|nr:hypothetical protein FACS189454_07010 [Planctomycetales bacterium]